MKLALASLVVMVILASGCVSAPIQDAEELASVEVKEYDGKRLDSVVTGFRENSIRGPQYIDIEDYTLQITGLVAENKSYTYDDILSNYQSYKKVVTLNCVEGWSATILWEGMKISELIEEAGPLPWANTIIFYAYDGYSTSFPLEYITDNDLLMAYKMNDVTMPPERGYPFQLVAESKWGYKWIKWITRIEISDDPSYRGYWEKTGYSNTGNLDEYYLE